MTKKQPVNPFDMALKEMAQFIEAVSHFEPDVQDFNPAMLLQSAEDGGLQFDNDGAKHYRKALKSLVNVATANEKLSAKAVEKLFQKQ